MLCRLDDLSIRQHPRSFFRPSVEAPPLPYSFSLEILCEKPPQIHEACLEHQCHYASRGIISKVRATRFGQVLNFCNTCAALQVALQSWTQILAFWILSRLETRFTDFRFRAVQSQRDRDSPDLTLDARKLVEGSRCRCLLRRISKHYLG